MISVAGVLERVVSCMATDVRTLQRGTTHLYNLLEQVFRATHEINGARMHEPMECFEVAAFPFNPYGFPKEKVDGLIEALPDPGNLRETGLAGR